ncbi:hypothetical protein EVB32_098 [Rhizobium phage RHph_TM39]|uniref:Uncharacterized protein n=1 Tax=Rhizobium phage RHph_TM30 TaxID=2509764 RepID=A0A7S5UUJ8_9CAUD|nr:hypothetical protein PQC16_gp098 [Rhizobium phage RHph_TM30]QIG71569.1 hypothetical protein EVB94_098 [Rhizobium phage RHph_TM40]QIG71932.1 hypothetical protein EVB95_098 [Rhizobium phage RHph_TM2_3B]QIG72294.1 hypothetical protein EVB96_098 [Rhizobium phage RHph_TM3_3_6]QIG77086.1 hypothetical protein EVB32_098 [Rhizobium phage RHph_TM39]QIG77424.1 hypothetical protein EVB61_096 [Rhizobium phage RHph_TM21B]
MSENVFDYGFMVPLKEKMTDDDRYDLSERLWNEKTGIHINHEGTIIYSAIRGNEYGIRFTQTSEMDSSAFMDSIPDYVPEVDDTEIRGYSCYWYNGSDSDMDCMTLERYRSYNNDSET